MCEKWGLATSQGTEPNLQRALLLAGPGQGAAKPGLPTPPQAWLPSLLQKQPWGGGVRLKGRGRPGCRIQRAQGREGGSHEGGNGSSSWVSFQGSPRGSWPEWWLGHWSSPMRPNWGGGEGEGRRKGKGERKRKEGGGEEEREGRGQAGRGSSERRGGVGSSSSDLSTHREPLIL